MQVTQVKSVSYRRPNKPRDVSARTHHVAKDNPFFVHLRMGDGVNLNGGRVNMVGELYKGSQYLAPDDLMLIPRDEAGFVDVVWAFVGGEIVLTVRLKKLSTAVDHKPLYIRFAAYEPRVASEGRGQMTMGCDGQLRCEEEEEVAFCYVGPFTVVSKLRLAHPPSVGATVQTERISDFFGGSERPPEKRQRGEHEPVDNELRNAVAHMQNDLQYMKDQLLLVVQNQQQLLTSMHDLMPNLVPKDFTNSSNALNPALVDIFDDIDLCCV